jgi:regulation of enolase protein 1 (concanavalin A-like superfamily)
MGKWLRTFRLFVLVMSAAFAAGCGSVPAPKKSMPVAAAPSSTPQPIEIQKPVNVSFSTYSKDWPVDWQWIDPDERNNPTPHDVRSGALRIEVPSKKDLHGDNRTAPRYLKSIKGDFQIETRVRFIPKENYQGAGLLIFQDDSNYLRFERAYGGIGGGGEGIRLDARKGSEHKPIIPPGEIQTEEPEVELKIVRSGRIFIAFWREDESREWREAGEYESDYPDTVLVGVVAVNTARPVTAEFAYIRLLPGTQR